MDLILLTNLTVLWLQVKSAVNRDDEVVRNRHASNNHERSSQTSVALRRKTGELLRVEETRARDKATGWGPSYSGEGVIS